MKTLLKAALLIALLALGASGWMAWRNENVRRDTRQAVGSAKGAVNEEILKNAERLAERLRAVQQTAEKNKETKK
ncbi:MAG: hypothetical protein HYY24_25700 [Verrucomicrobia bacterium]|nr:hypothetical protein [Verrucomicrobiota bacterium]